MVERFLMDEFNPRNVRVVRGAPVAGRGGAASSVRPTATAKRAPHPRGPSVRLLPPHPTKDGVRPALSAHPPCRRACARNKHARCRLQLSTYALTMFRKKMNIEGKTLETGVLLLVPARPPPLPPPLLGGKPG